MKIEIDISDPEAIAKARASLTVFLALEGDLKDSARHLLDCHDRLVITAAELGTSLPSVDAYLAAARRDIETEAEQEKAANAAAAERAAAHAAAAEAAREAKAAAEAAD